MAASLTLTVSTPLTSSSLRNAKDIPFSSLNSIYVSSSSLFQRNFTSLSLSTSKCRSRHRRFVVSCHLVPSPPEQVSTKLYVSGLSFRTTEETLRNAFQDFGQLVEVNLVMDRIANRPRGFAFLRYATVEESKKAIEGMHGKFLDGRVIFVEVSKPKSELRQGFKQTR
ncbi:hypothetical protein AQUCO_00201328v1 [Aquilegia coerulea]|uniref:RRM domain-containing protein n=1 Tax=Aquilegia coerulea TaxID=218851 RepID=A0A2G5F7M3_AQUCA|nr:hypothetical protein AQUCO_00201328v1 [Aquilegia coerulea]